MPDDMSLSHTADVRDETARSIDRLVFTSILEKALTERDRLGGSLAKRVGIGGTALAILLMLHVPGHPALPPADYVGEDECEEQGWIRDLLMRNVSTELEISRWLAGMVARRAMEANHLYEDLGFSNRALLTQLMKSHFGLIAERNVDDMRWKRFFYRMMCEEDGYSHCTSPACSNCVDVDRCFEPSSVEAMIARSKAAPA